MHKNQLNRQSSRLPVSQKYRFKQVQPRHVAVDEIEPQTATITAAQLSKASGDDAPETRTQRLENDLVEKKTSFIETIFAFLSYVIVVFYSIFIIVVLCLFLSGLPFHKDFPVTGIVLVGMTGSIPTILSLTLLVGLFKETSKKEKDKEKDDKGAMGDMPGLAKAFVEAIKLIKHS